MSFSLQSMLLLSLLSPTLAFIGFGDFCQPKDGRCWYGFGTVMHSGDPCKGSCVLFSFLYPSLECGYCPGQEPTAESLPGAIPATQTAPTPTTPTLAVPTRPTPSPPSNDPTISYNIGYAMSSGVPADVEARFAQAIQKWESVVVGDLPDVTYPSTEDKFGCTFPQEIDDVFFCLATDTVPSDGPGKVVGWGGYFRRRDGNTGLPTKSYISLDSADTEWFTLPVLTHEVRQKRIFGV